MTGAIGRRSLLLASAGLVATPMTLHHGMPRPIAGFSRQEDAGALRTALFIEPMRLTDAQWRRRLAPDAYEVLRQKRDETPFSSALHAEKRAGRYACAGCRLSLFLSDAKYDSGVGLPSFESALPRATVTRLDLKGGVARQALYCARCDGFLGQAFHDGPGDFEMRYSPGGAALAFIAT